MAHNVVIVTHLTECFKAAQIQHKFYTACAQCNTSAVSSRLPSNKSDSKQSFLLMTMHEISNPIAPTQNGFLIASVKGYSKYHGDAIIPSLSRMAQKSLSI
jgi:hypothetical protein